MKSAVKTLALLSIFSVFTVSSVAQLKLSLVNPIAGDLRRVLDDYPNNFKNLVGEMIDQSGQTTEFNCKFTMAGAEQTTVTQYSSKNQNVRSWQALMLTTESFDKAKQKFKSLYGQINHLDVSPADGNFRLKGEWEQPQEQKDFVAIVFSLKGASDESLKKLKVELTLQYELLEWKIRIVAYSREREDDERGKTRD